MIVIILFIFVILLILFLLANIIVYRRNANIARHINTLVPRNIDRLIIGDYCNYSNVFKEGVLVAKLSPSKQTDQSLVLIAQRLFSLLDEENGVLTIVQRDGKRQKRGISVFDIPYLHENTLEDLNKTWMKNLCKLPLLFDFVSSLKILFVINGSSNLLKTECPINELIDFCNCRNIKLEYFKII